jgi:hypothetical protein
MAEEILSAATTEEAPIVEAPIAESDATEETIPDGIENLKLLHTALSGDKEYVDLVPKEFKKFIQQYSDGENATLLFQSLRGDSEYSDMIPSDAVEAASMFGVTINPKSWGKPSAVPSASVDGGSATRRSGVVQPSSSQPNVDNQFGLGGIAAQVGKETELSREVNAFGNYEDKQSYFAKVDKAKREIVDNKNSSYVLPNTEEGQRIYKDATGLRYDFLKREADAAQAKMSAALNPIINKDINEKYLTKNDDGFLVPDVEKIDQYAKDLARRYNLPEDGYLKEVIYNEAKSMASYKELEPEVNKRFEKLIQPNLVATGLIEKSNQEVWKNFTTDEVEQVELDKKVGTLAADLKVKSKADEDAIQYELGKQVSNLDMSYAQIQAQTTAQFENLDNQYKNGMPRQQYEAEFNKLQEASKQSYDAYSDDRLKLFDEGQKALNQISNKYNGQLRRQTEELNNIAREKVNKAALQYQKKYGKNPKLEAEIKKLYEKAYLETVDAKNNEIDKYNKSRATELVLKYKQFGGMAAMADRFLRSVDSAAGGSLKGLGTSLGINSLQVYGDFLQGSVSLPEAKTKEFKDLFDPLNLSQVSGQLAGGMAPTIVATAAVGALTKNAPTMYQMAATGAASFFTESADIAGRMRDETFAKTQSAAKANEASEKSWSAQYKIIPLYAFSGLPFIKTAGTWMKTLPRVARMTLGALAEIAEEIPQEVTQGVNEENISAGLDPFDNYYEKVSADNWKRLKETTIQILPVGFLGALGQMSGKREKTNREQMQLQVSNYAAQAKVNERIGNMQGQWVSQMVAKKGDAFAITTINALFSDGTIDEQTRDQLQEHVATSKKNFEDAKTLGLSESEGVVYDALTQAYLEKKAQYEQAQQNGDEILADNLNADMTNIRNQAKEFAQNKQGDFFVFQFADGSQKVVTNSKWSSDAQILELIASGQVGVSAYSENGKASLDSLNPKVEEQKLLQLERNNKVPQSLTDKIEQLRKQEQAENDATDPNDKAKLKEIYDRYDKAITPLLEQQDALIEQEPVAEEVELESGLQGENAIVEFQENNPELKDIPLSTIEENLGIGDMVYGNIVGQEVFGKVNNVGIHKGQIVVDIVDQNGNPRFLYSRNIERIEPKQKEVERLNAEQSKRRLELLNQEEITVDEINELDELGKISRGEIPNPSKALQAPTEEFYGYSKENPKIVENEEDAIELEEITPNSYYEKISGRSLDRASKTGKAWVVSNQVTGEVYFKGTLADAKSFLQDENIITSRVQVQEKEAAPVQEEAKVEIESIKKESGNINTISELVKKAGLEKSPQKFLFDIADKYDVKIGDFKSENKKVKANQQAEGLYTIDDNTIYINWDKIDSVEKLNEVFAHEVIHALIANKFERNSYKQFNSELDSDLRKFRNTILPLLDKEKTPFTKDFANRIRVFGGYEELATYGLTHKEFAKWLDSIPAEGVKNESKTLWGRLKDIILNYIGKITDISKTQLDILNEILDKHLDFNSLEKKEQAPQAEAPTATTPITEEVKVMSLEDYDGTTEGEVKLSDTVSIKKEGDSYFVTANDFRGDARTYSPMTLKEAKVFAENQLIKENKGENINLKDYSTKEINANELKVGDVYSRTIGGDRFVFELLSEPEKSNGQFYTSKVRVLDIGSYVNKKELDASGNAKTYGSRVVGQVTIDAFKDSNSGISSKVKFGKVTLINDFNKNEVSNQVNKIFKDNPDLASIGTVEQYTQYLDTVFPDSQFKNIVYHVSPNKFTEFKDPSSSGFSNIWFSEKPLTDQYGNNIYAVVLDIKNPLSEWSSEYRKEINAFEAPISQSKEGIPQYKYDSTIRSSRVDNGKSITVRSPKQINILGSNKDIEGFRKFVNPNQKATPVVQTPTEQAQAAPQVQEVEEYQPITIKEIYNDSFSKENAMYYDEGERELDSGRMSIYVASMTMDVTNDDGDSIGALTKLVDDDKNVTWNGEDYEGAPLSDDDFETMNEAKQAIVDRWNKKQKKEFDKQAKKDAREQEKAELKAAKAEARAKAKSESKAPKAATKAPKESIFVDFDSTNNAVTIKNRAEANKAFKEKHGDNAAVAKAISTNFEAIANELKAKGIFTKIEC